MPDAPVPTGPNLGGDGVDGPQRPVLPQISRERPGSGDMTAQDGGPAPHGQGQGQGSTLHPRFGMADRPANSDGVPVSA